jgi:hypothetical protein
MAIACAMVCKTAIVTERTIDILISMFNKQSIRIEIERTISWWGSRKELRSRVQTMSRWINWE